MNIVTATSNLRQYLQQLLEQIAKSNQSIRFFKPAIVRIINNNIDKAAGIFQLLADKSGDIDLASILPEMMQSVDSSTPFNIEVPVIGNVEIGNGSIKFSLPLTDNRISLSREDLQAFINTMTKN